MFPVKANKYGISLRHLERGDLEVLRRNRNNPRVNLYLNDRNYITKKAQMQWYESLPEKFYPYMIIYKRNKIGFLYFRIDKNNIAWGSIFCWHTKFLNTPVPIAANFLALEIYFTELNYTGSLHAIVHSDNINANKMVVFLGYELIKQSTFNEYILTKERFKNHTITKEKFFHRIMNSKKDLKITFS